jgi:hypothetical protein
VVQIDIFPSSAVKRVFPFPSKTGGARIPPVLVDNTIGRKDILRQGRLQRYSSVTAFKAQEPIGSLQRRHAAAGNQTSHGSSDVLNEINWRCTNDPREQIVLFRECVNRLRQDACDQRIHEPSPVQAGDERQRHSTKAQKTVVVDGGEREAIKVELAGLQSSIQSFDQVLATLGSVLGGDPRR